MEESQTNQQPAKVEGEADVLDLPVGLVSGSLASVSAETLENPVPPLQWNLAAEMEETIEHLMKTLLNDVETNVEQRLNKMDIKKDDPPEEDAKSTKRYNRRGTRGKGRMIIYQRDNNPQDSATNEIRVSAHRTGAEGLRGKCREVEEERKNPPETPRPKAHPHQQQRMMERHEEKTEHPQWKREQGQRTQQGLSERRSSGQRDVRKNWGDERRQVFHPRRTQEETERRPDRNDGRKAHPHQQQRMMERHKEKRERPQWKKEQGQRTQGLSERRSSGQRDVRKNWGDERSQEFHPRRVQEERRPDRNDSGVSAPKGGAEELRGQCRNVQEERKTPVENPRPKTHPHQQTKTEEHGEPREHPHWKRGQRTQHTFIPRSSQKDNRRNRNEERRQVFRPSQDQEQTDKRSTAVTDSSTALRTGETERRAREDPRVESTPPRTERNAGRERRGGEPRVRRPPWWKHDSR
ncbi:hypothetical protein SRHO_G00099400 [Serrasalmus rhombeus]